MNPPNGIFPETPWENFGWQETARHRYRRHAVSVFCDLYWRPVFNVVRSRRVDLVEAEDLTQAFLLHFIQSGAIERVHPAKGRFRDFLSAALSNYLTNEQARAQTLKRGGGHIPIGLEQACLAENPCLTDASRGSTSCDRLWAARLIESARAKLEMEYALEERRLLFLLLLPHVMGDAPPPYDKLVLRLRRDAATLRSDVKRLRARFRETLLLELRKRVGVERADAEMEALREILREGRWIGRSVGRCQNKLGFADTL